MFSLELVRELYAHMEWADSKVWQAVLTTPQAGSDSRFRDRLFHIHLTQRAFLQVWTDQPIERFQALRFEDLQALYAWVRPYYRQVAEFLGGLQPTQLTAPTPVPWAKRFVQHPNREPAVTTLGQTLFQVTSHSTYHRGQVNARLRELGGEPPLVDYIAWLWQGRPQAAWPGSGGRPAVGGGA